jgi:hypothetical protein
MLLRVLGPLKGKTNTVRINQVTKSNSSAWTQFYGLCKFSAHSMKSMARLPGIWSPSKRLPQECNVATTESWDIYTNQAPTAAVSFSRSVFSCSLSCHRSWSRRWSQGDHHNKIKILNNLHSLANRWFKHGSVVNLSDLGRGFKPIKLSSIFTIMRLKRQG